MSATTLPDLVAAVKAMRTTQKAFFDKRKRGATRDEWLPLLKASQEAERGVDKMIVALEGDAKERAEQQGTMFK
jgi:hypothetical protein